jgi:hypothetical protein
MLSAPGDVFPVRRVASCASSSEISCGNGIVLQGLTWIQGSWISSSAVRRSRVARRSCVGLIELGFVDHVVHLEWRRLEGSWRSQPSDGLENGAAI